MISTSDFCAAFSVWWIETKGEDRRTPSNESIGRALVAFADPRIGIDPNDLRDNRHRYSVTTRASISMALGWTTGRRQITTVWHAEKRRGPRIVRTM
jgi:hypothetical protein